MEGILVLDLTRLFAGSYCTMLLADLGAEVVKVEEPGAGDPLRLIPPFFRGEGYTFMMMNRNKKSLTLNLRREEGRELFHRLATRSDVVVENFAPGVMEGMGLGYEALGRLNPRLVYASVSGFGHRGPYRSRLAADMVAQAMGGIMSVTGPAGGPPHRAGPGVVSFASALYGALAIAHALLERERTGLGQAIDIALQDCAWALSAYEYAPEYFMAGQVVRRTGNRHPYTAPYSCYRARDGYVVIATATDGHWRSLLRALGREDLLGEARFATVAKRAQHAAEVDEIVEAWTATRTSEEIDARLGEAHVAAGPVLDMDQVAQDPNLAARDMVVEVEHPRAGRVKVPGSALKLSRTPGRVRFPSPLVGEHNQELYPRLLGLDEPELARLKKEGII